MYADPRRCPECRGPIGPDTQRCPQCGLRLTGPAAVELFRTLQRADTLIARLREERPEAPVQEERPEASPDPAAAAQEEGPVAIPKAAAPSVPAAFPAPPPAPAPRRRWTVPAVLLSLGGLCLAVGAIVFLAVTWSLLGIGGRTAVLVALTLAAAVGASLCATRRLRGAAETLSALAALLFALDLAGGFAAEWFGSPTVLTATAVGGAVVTGMSLAAALLLVRRSVPLVAPQLAVLLAGLVATVAAVLETEGSPWTWAAASALALAVMAVGFRSGQAVLRVGAAALAALAWLGLAARGLVDAVDYLDGWAGRDVRALLLAGALAAVVALLPSRVAGVLRPLRVVGGAVALWWWTFAAALPALDSVTGVTVVPGALAVVAAAGVLALGGRARPEPVVAVPEALRLTAVSAAAWAVLSALVQVVALGWSILAGVASAPAEWSATYELIDTGHAPWVPLVGAAALLASWVGARVRLPPVPALVGVVVGAAGLVLLVLLPHLVLPAAAVFGLAVAAAGTALRSLPGSAWRSRTWPAATVLGAAALYLTSFQPLLLLTALATAAAVAVLTLRLGHGVERTAAAATAAPLLAVTALRAALFTDLSDGWVAGVVVAATLLVVAGLVVAHWVPDTWTVEAALHAGSGAVVLAGALAALDTRETAPGLLTAVAVAAYAGWLLFGDDAVPGVVAGSVLVPAVGVAVLNAVTLLGDTVPSSWRPAGVHLVALAVMVGVVLALRWRPPRLRYGLLGGAAPVLASTLLATVVDAAPGPALVVTGSAALVAVATLRWNHPDEAWGSAALAAPLVAAAAWYAVEVLGAGEPWRYAAALTAAPVVVLGVSLTGWGRLVAPTVERRWAAYLTLGVVAFLGTLAGADVADARVLTWLAVYLTLSSAAAAVLGIAERNRWLAALASGLALGALWARLLDTEIDVPEAYTLPLALAVLAFGAWTFLRDRSTRSLRTLGPGLGLGLLPSLVLAVDDPISLRALLLGLACLGLVALGAVRRWQAPLLLGAVVGAVLVVREVLPYSGGVPRWVLLSAAGLVLLVAGVRWEQLAGAGKRVWGRIVELR